MKHCDERAVGCPDSPGCRNAKCACHGSPLQRLGQLLAGAGAVMTLTMTADEWRAVLAHHVAELAANSDDAKGQLRKLTINLPSDLANDLKVLAAARGTSASSVIRGAIWLSVYVQKVVDDGGKILVKTAGEPNRELVIR